MTPAPLQHRLRGSVKSLRYTVLLYYTLYISLPLLLLLLLFLNIVGDGQADRRADGREKNI